MLWSAADAGPESTSSAFYLLSRTLCSCTTALSTADVSCVKLASAPCRRLSESDRGGSPRQRGPRGATWLPSRYRLQRVHVQRQAGLRWADEFDFSFYNRTRFAGLENGVANCYVNSLVQVSVQCTV